MRFTLLDRVVSVVPGKSITAIKTLTLSEEYLADHFPRFPVMPGVLMLEAMTQAAAWTIRLGEDFAHSIVVLRQAKNVKYGDFVEPGRVLTVTAEVISQDETTTKVKASGTVGDRTSLTARLVLERYNMADRRPYGDAIDALTLHHRLGYTELVNAIADRREVLRDRIILAFFDLSSA